MAHSRPKCTAVLQFGHLNLCPRLKVGSKRADFDDSNDPILYTSGWKLCVPSNSE